MFNILRALHQVMHDTNLNQLELEGVVHKRLKAVLISAYMNVPYYREIMQSIGYDPALDYNGPKDLSLLPITTSETLKREGTRFLKNSHNLSKYHSETTSGSRGIPLRVYRAPYERGIQIARWLRVLFVNGYSVRHKVMALVSPERAKYGRSIIQRFGLLRRLAVDYLRHSIGQMVDLFLTYNPDVLYGNRSHVDLIALELKRRRIEPESLHLQLLIGGAEVITASSRRLYRETFGVQLIECYGSEEMGVMAYETPAHNGLRLCEDLTYFEFLDQDGNPVPHGEPGKVIVTDLTGKLMPFIRYDQGDLVVFENEYDVNGYPIRKITQIIGRENDYLLLPDGTLRPAHDLYKVIGKYEKIVQFRIIQRTRILLEILIVADTSYFLSIRDKLKKQLQQNFPQTVNFKIIQVDEISPDPNGKIRTLISEAS